jgi:hypothetical protein
MNSGAVRVLMGSTVMLGTGVNAQRRAVAIHHFDIPWKPSEMEQRNGRVSRPGNIVAKEFADNKVDCFIYATEKTLDTYKFNILQNKQTFINQMKRNSLGLRSIDEGDLSENGAMNFAEYVAVMSGNNDLLEKAKLESMIMGLENERKAFNNNRSKTENQLNRITHSLESKRARLICLSDDWEYINEVAPPDENGKRPNPIQLDGFQSSSAIEIGSRLIEINKKTDTGGRNVIIGKLFGFDLAVRSYRGYKDEKNNLFFVIGKNGSEYFHNSGILSDIPEKAARFFVSAFEQIPRLIESTKKDVKSLENDVPVLEKILENTWNNAPKLQKLKTELEVLDRKIGMTLDAINEQIAK